MSIVGISKCLKRIINPAIYFYFSTNAAVVTTEPEIMYQNKNGIVWIDMEMTGLDIENHRILELACLITDEKLNIISDEFSRAIHQPESELSKMNEWAQEVHGKNGIIDASRKSKENEESVDKDLLDFMIKYVPKGKCPMAGNSVYMDRMFLRKFMPEANEFMHYRIIDVSSIKEIVKRWNPDIFNKAPRKQYNHKSFDDIKESIAELNYYKDNIFLSNISN